MANNAGSRADRAPGGVFRRLAAALLLAGVLIALSGATGASRASAAEAGVNVSPSAARIPDLTALGTHWVRMFVSWRGLQPTPGAIAPSALASFEQVLEQLPAGTKVILDVVGTPRWETGSADEHAPPARPSDYAAFVGTLAQRLGTRVSAYEIWNEEDSSGWWAGGPDPAAYARLLKATYPVVKAADPSAAVVLGGLTGNDYAFLEGVYEAGGKGSFDAVGVHTDTACDVLSPYDFLRGADNRLIPDSFLAYREVRAVMLANGDDKPIWMTEMSWRTTAATCSEGAWAGQKPAGVTEEQQATYLSQAYHCLAQDPYVQVALWYPLQDEGGVLSGLVRANGSRKPSFVAMRNYARSGDRLQQSCGVFTGPRISVTSPANHVTYSGPLPIRVSAASAQGVGWITLRIDGKRIYSYGSHRTYPPTLSGTLDWQGAKHIPYGRHTLTFIAYDKEHNVSERSLTIYHRPPKTRPRHRRHHPHH
ncbi:MAG TPA: cellulase family glycosylhydrolase [Solirubrobacteraceae bacterium]|nr:cellulase family glycosylhydrolase [Solirubrobacteraceae bacterium]